MGALQDFLHELVDHAQLIDNTVKDELHDLLERITGDGSELSDAAPESNDESAAGSAAGGERQETKDSQSGDVQRSESAADSSAT